MGTKPAQLAFEVSDWLGSSLENPVERATLGSMQILVGPDRVPLTEVQDTIARTVRSHINIPASAVAEWLLINWWRLRWEPRPKNPGQDWLRSHSMAAISGGYAWPALEVFSDGEFVYLEHRAERSTDVSAVRYLRDVSLQIPAKQFEAAVVSLVEQVQARLALREPNYRDLSELRSELVEECANERTAQLCKLQALAGFDPGSADEDWLARAAALSEQAGDTAAMEILATVPSLSDGLASAEATLEAMKNSAITVRLDWAKADNVAPREGELPWERGERLARSVRAKLGLPTNPISDDRLQGWLESDEVLCSHPWSGEKAFRGGVRDDTTNGRARVLVTGTYQESKRFYLARLVAASLGLATDQNVLPVCDSSTALQKFGRAFAQEFLCPWEDLDHFTHDEGTDDEAIGAAARRYMVSEWAVRSALVNKGKLSRERLPYD